MQIPDLMPQNPPFTVALVLGAAVWPDQTPSPTLKRRANHAAKLYSAGQVSHIIGCGGLGQHGPSEAEMIRRICIDAGVPETAISLEDRSTTTQENIVNALPMLKKLDTQKLVIVTDKYHALRAKLVARHLGLTPHSACPPLKGSRPLHLLYSYLREIPALLVYFLRLRYRS